jgi:hypothetical protein
MKRYCSPLVRRLVESRTEVSLLDDALASRREAWEARNLERLRFHRSRAAVHYCAWAWKVAPTDLICPPSGKVLARTWEAESWRKYSTNQLRAAHEIWRCRKDKVAVRLLAVAIHAAIVERTGLAMTPEKELIPDAYVNGGGA